MLRSALPLALLALLAACSGDAEVVIIVDSQTHTGTWVGPISDTSVMEWTLAETPDGSGAAITGAGEIRSQECRVDIDVTGTRTGDDTFLTVTTPLDPTFEMTVSGEFQGERFAGIFSVTGGAPSASCLSEVGGLLRVGPRNDAGLNGAFLGVWQDPAPDSTFTGGVFPQATVHLVTTGTDVFGTVDWTFYPCAEGGYLSGTFDGEHFLANVQPANSAEAFHVLDATWFPETEGLSGSSTLLSPGPVAECATLLETVFSMHAMDVLLPLQQGAPRVEPVGVAHRFGPDGAWRSSGVVFRARESAPDADQDVAPRQ